MESLNKKLQQHPLYRDLNSLPSLQIFMETHVFAVWDFMSLLKSLQRQITCVSVPWVPSKHSSSMVRMVNQIVLGEESDIDQNGKPQSHFELYLSAMKEINASTALINDFIADLNTEKLPEHIKRFVEFNLDIAIHSPLHIVAGAFLFGREKIIPEMFEGIIKDLNRATCPTLIYYLERHIQLDGEEHSHLALACLKELCQGDEIKWNEAMATGKKSLEMRHALWDSVHKAIQV